MQRSKYGIIEIQARQKNNPRLCGSASDRFFEGWSANRPTREISFESLEPHESGCDHFHDFVGAGKNGHDPNVTPGS